MLYQVMPSLRIEHMTLTSLVPYFTVWATRTPQQIKSCVHYMHYPTAGVQIHFPEKFSSNLNQTHLNNLVKIFRITRKLQTDESDQIFSFHVAQTRYVPQMRKQEKSTQISFRPHSEINLIWIWYACFSPHHTLCIMFNSILW